MKIFDCDTVGIGSQLVNHTWHDVEKKKKKKNSELVIASLMGLMACSLTGTEPLPKSMLVWRILVKQINLGCTHTEYLLTGLAHVGADASGELVLVLDGVCT